MEIPKTSLLRILIEDLCNIKNLGILFQHDLSEDRKQARVHICYNNLLHYRRRHRLLEWTLVIDEIYIPLY